MATMTKQKQYRRISAGVALGLIINDCYKLPNNKVRVELAFTSAWLQWAHGNAYPWMQRTATMAVKDLDVIHIITEMDKDKRDPFMPFYWDSHAPEGPTIYARANVDFDPNDDDNLEFLAGHLDNENHIPAQAWGELASVFLEKLVRD